MRLASNTPSTVEEGRLIASDVADQLNMLCHIRKTPNILYGIFTELLKQFYSNTHNIPIELPAGTVYTVNKNTTGIWIDSELQWDVDAIEFRPAIYVGLQDINYSSVTGKQTGRIGMDLKQGERIYARRGEGVVTFNHVGSQQGEGVAYAGATLDFLDAFSDVIRDEFNFETFALIRLTPIQVEKESKERYKSIVAFKFTFQDTWTIKIESPKLKKVVFSAGQNLFESGIV